ncbi:MAG: hypothetical protein LBO62_06385 [Endomicrobium sp.]|nr:hypothetical protein [Endomicrobium sp.]
MSVISEFISESTVKRQLQKKQQTTDTERDAETDHERDPETNPERDPETSSG